MLTKQRTTLELFNQVNSFIDSNPVVLASSPDGYADQVQIFKTSLGVIQQATANQVTGTASQTAVQRQAARQALRIGQLHPLRKIARVLERTVAGMPHLVSIPKKTASTPALVAAAKAAVQDVTPYQAQFVGKGMPPNFLDQVSQAIQAVQDADAANVSAKQVMKSAQGQLTMAVHEAKDAVTCLDVIVRRACAADPANGSGTLAVWNTIVPPPVKLTVAGSMAASSVASGTAAGAASGTAATSGTAGGSGSASPVTTGSGSGSAGQAAAASSGSSSGTPAAQGGGVSSGSGGAVPAGSAAPASGGASA